jgi:hypothetical protein
MAQTVLAEDFYGFPQSLLEINHDHFLLLNILKLTVISIQEIYFLVCNICTDRAGSKIQPTLEQISFPSYRTPVFNSETPPVHLQKISVIKQNENYDRLRKIKMIIVIIMSVM